jgi:non-ribosomal peptide synthetase component E (peptide arylation enzyme)
VVTVESRRLDVSALQTFLTERRVARFKIPEQLEIWESLPRNTLGKVLKHEIRAKLLAAMSPTGAH